MNRSSLLQSTGAINRKNVSNQIMDMISDFLLSGKLKAGDKLPTETEFVETLGVGRNSIREAMKMLFSLGIIEIRRGEGTFIMRTPSPSILNPMVISMVQEQGSSRELIELRLALETMAGEFALSRGNQLDLRPLTEVNERLRQEARKAEADMTAIGELDLDFHRKLYELSGNRFLVKISEIVYKLFQASVERTSSSDPDLAYRNHNIVITALRKGDTAALREHMQQSLQYWQQAVEGERMGEE